MKKEISLNDLAKVILKKAWLIVILTVAGAILAYAISAYAITPKYTSETKLSVYNPYKEESGNYVSSDLTLTRALIEAYIEVLNGNNVLKPVADKLNELKGTVGYEYLKNQDYTMSYIKSTISASALGDTPIFTIKVTTETPEESQLILGLLIEEFTPEFKRLIKAGDFELFYSPTLPVSPSSPSIPRNTLIGALLGLVIAAAIILLIYMTDSAVHDESDLTEAFEDITVLGVIPVIQTTPQSGSGDSAKQSI